ISATFAINTYTIAASAGSNGSITPSGNTTVNCGDNQSYSITADACYHIADVLVDGSSVGAVASYTFSDVQANHTISATFTIIPCTSLLRSYLCNICNQYLHDCSFCWSERLYHSFR